VSTIRTFELDIAVTRGNDLESIHRVHAAVIGADGSLVGGARDPRFLTHWRSCAKPFQVMPLLASGAFDDLAWGNDELALAVASHGGEPEHVAIATRMLADVGLEEGDLACGPHEPMAPRGQKILRESGARPTRLHNNCSGKHAAMLARAHVAGWKTAGYEKPEHPVQQACLESVSKWSGLATSELGRAVDGCGVVEFSSPLDALARAWSRLATAMTEDDLARRIHTALRARPLLFGGSDRFDSIMIEETDGRVIAKVGAEGVHAAAIPGQGIAVVVKVEDGAKRAQFPAILRALQYLDALPATLPPRLEEFRRRSLRNTRGETVGEIRPVA
jgi:L-asparaginase II